MPKQSCATIIRRMVNLKKKRLCTEEFFRIWGILRGQLYDTPEYKAFMLEVRARSAHTCTGCSKRGRHVHHIVRVYVDPTKSVDPDNGTYLCIKCHKKEHSDGTGRVKSFKPRARNESVSNKRYNS